LAGYFQRCRISGKSKSRIPDIRPDTGYPALFFNQHLNVSKNTENRQAAIKKCQFLRNFKQHFLAMDEVKTILGVLL
jgi:hypothetical protein